MPLAACTGVRWVVLPKSLAADENGRPTDQSSFASRQVLKYVLTAAGPADHIYLAPTPPMLLAAQSPKKWRHIIVS